MKSFLLWILLTSCFLTLNAEVKISGELKKWHKVTIDFIGPDVSETDVNNPFLNYRLNVLFKHKASGKEYLVPGYFAADGNAANSSSDKGNVWRVHFSPDETGEWNFKADFRTGEDIAVSNDPKAGRSAGFMDKKKGGFKVAPTDKGYPDFRARGRLQYVGEHYLKFAETGEYFLKCGADAPENLFAYIDFDGDFASDGKKDHLVKNWQPHVKDWNPGDPVWKEGKGKGLIGAVNYLASQGMNAMSFLTFNIAGDDQNVFPYLNYDERFRMDVSRLSQWEIIMEHAQSKGVFLHFKLSEAENQKLLDKGALGRERKLYYREIIARFGHHLALNWNLGEENGTWGSNVKGQTSEQRRDMAGYFFENDPYNHHLVIHNGQWFDDMYGDKSALTGASLQTSLPDFSEVHRMTLSVYLASEKAGKPWAVACDEPGDAQKALAPDKINPNHDNARKNALWGHFLAGGWGIEWYFGYEYEQSDLTCQDWRSRDKMWKQSRFALDFFRNYQIPFQKMRPNDDLSKTGNWILASPANESQFYSIIQLQEGGDCIIDLPTGNFEYGWFNPHSGIGLTGLLHPGKTNGGKESKFTAPDSRDWILLVGPEGKLKPENSNIRPEPMELFSFFDFAISKKQGYVPGYKDQANRVLAINAAQYPDKFAAGEVTFSGASDTYDVIITTLTETDGECSYKLLVNGKILGEFQNPPTEVDYFPVTHRWKNLKINNGDEIVLAYNSHSNGKIPENDAFAFARGRWRSLTFVKPGEEHSPLVDLDWSEQLPEIDMSYFTFEYDPGSAERVHEETDGLLVVEAENYAWQNRDSVRRWYLTTNEITPDVKPDHDGNHSKNASGMAYMEVLPDTRVKQTDPLVQLVNFTEDPGRMAVLYYPVWINKPGRYYVWVRTCPTGSEDNSLHVGIDGIWPVSAQRMQWISQKSQWHWDSKQRTDLVHTGVKYRIYLDIKKPGLHTIMFSMREDGFEFDKWLLSTDKDVLEHGELGLGPDESKLKTMK